MYASFECYIGINPKQLSKPHDVAYTLLPNMAYFELLSMEKNHEDQVALRNGVSDQNCVLKDDEIQKLERANLVDVKLRHSYELVVTTSTSRYRDRVGDILMVIGFHNNAPQFRFMHRRNVVLSVDTDKTNEQDLVNAVTQAKPLLEPLGFLLIEYTSYAYTSSIPGHYGLFREVRVKGNNDVEELIGPRIMEQCCSTMEESLDSAYSRCKRKDQSIGPLQIRTLDTLVGSAVSEGCSVNQYKTPRCIKSDSRIVRILLSIILALIALFFLTQAHGQVVSQCFEVCKDAFTSCIHTCSGQVKKCTDVCTSIEKLCIQRCIQLSRT